KYSVGPAVDIWALGVMLFELLCGRRPFDAESRQATLERVAKVDPPSLRSTTTGVDRGLETVVRTCLEKRPENRYTTADALADDLDRWDAGSGVKGRQQSWQRLMSRWSVRRIAFFLGIAVLVGATAMASTAVPKFENAIDWNSDVATPAKLQWVQEQIR